MIGRYLGGGVIIEMQEMSATSCALQYLFLCREQRDSAMIAQHKPASLGV